MKEENKINKKTFFKKGKFPNKEIELKEIRLERMSPGFNLVSLKARYRLNEFKQTFTRAQYREYIKKCKNMYSISSMMNNHYSISDLYLREKTDISDIISIFNKIDSKLDSQKIKVATIKKNRINNLLKGKSFSSLNFFKKKSDFVKFSSNINKFKFMHKNLNKKNIKVINNKEDNKEIHFNNNQNMNCTSYDAKNNLKNLSDFNLNDGDINNRMSKTTYKNKKLKNNVFNNKEYSSLRNSINFSNINRNKVFNKTAYSSLLSNYKNFKIGKNNKNEINFKKPLIRNNSDFNIFYNIQAKQFPLSCRNSEFKVTKFGAMIYNHSMFRNKNIISFMPENYNLPLLYNNIK